MDFASRSGLVKELSLQWQLHIVERTGRMKTKYHIKLYLEFETESKSPKFTTNALTSKLKDLDLQSKLKKKTKLEANLKSIKAARNLKHKFHLDFGLVPYIQDFPFPSVTSRSQIIRFYNSQASLRKADVIHYEIK